MTVEELRKKISESPFNDNTLPSSMTNIMFVDAETFGNVCQFIFKQLSELQGTSVHGTLCVSIGINGGILFKGFELVIEK